MTINKDTKRQIRHKRIRAKIFGTENKPRLAVFRSNTGLSAQIVNDEIGQTLAQATTKSLKLKGNTVDNAKKIGAEIAKLAKAKGVEEVVFDRGGFLYSGKIKALAESARENGLKF